MENQQPPITDPSRDLDKNAIILIFLALAILVGGIIFVMRNNTSTEDQAATSTDQGLTQNQPDSVLGEQATPSTSPVASPSATPSATMFPEVTELVKEDLVIGTGTEAVAGKQITVHYTGTLRDGTKFDSSLDRGQPFTFQLGAGQVIQGWDQGFEGMKVGGKRRLLIPYQLAYGEQGYPPQIPPKAQLVFEVELLQVQ